jgi:hypothetical protein
VRNWSKEREREKEREKERREREKLSDRDSATKRKEIISYTTAALFLLSFSLSDSRRPRYLNEIFCSGGREIHQTS